MPRISVPRVTAFAIAVAAAATVAVTVPAAAQQTINLTAISGYPPPATWIGSLVDAYLPAVDAQLAETGNFKINWNKGISGQIVKPRGELEGVETGLGDLGVIVTAFHADKVPLYDVSFKTPFSSNDIALISATTQKMIDTFPQYDETWLKQFNQVALGATGAVDNYMLWSNKQITDIEQVKGLKVGAAGPNLPWVTAIGAAGVQTNLADAYNSLNTGIYEAMIVWRQGAGAFKLCEPAPFAYDATLGGVNGHTLNVNSDVWEGLPDEVKKALQDSAQAWVDENVKRVNDGAKSGLARCEAEFGTKVTKATPEQRQAWAMALPPLGKQWAEERNKAGQPGTEILKAWMDEMRANNQPIARHWDRD
jgi:TRAP-type C4-dicarboxylate transport system substrate-binding protein